MRTSAEAVFAKAHASHPCMLPSPISPLSSKTYFNATVLAEPASGEVAFHVPVLGSSQEDSPLRLANKANSRLLTPRQYLATDRPLPFPPTQISSSYVAPFGTLLPQGAELSCAGARASGQSQGREAPGLR